MTGEVVKWVDDAMFEAEPMPEDAVLSPKVHLVMATPDPLGAMAAACMMYEGKPVRDLRDVTDDQRRNYLEQVMKTSLQAPMEFIDLHFLIEGCTRAFTHQLVRQRTAVYAQESMRFAVKNNFAAETPMPPSLTGRKDDDPAVVQWRRAMDGIQESYNALVNAGIPGEDARGLLPHQTTTRIHYKTNLRGLAEHAGNRLCTQAQFEWRLVFVGIMQAIANYNPGKQFFEGDAHPYRSGKWQFEAIARSPIFRPVCYKHGKCGFMAQFDRGCTIRERVDQNAAAGRPSDQWARPLMDMDKVDLQDMGGNNDLGDTGDAELIPAIHPAEWLMDPTAAHGKIN